MLLELKSGYLVSKRHSEEERSKIWKNCVFNTELENCHWNFHSIIPQRWTSFSTISFFNSNPSSKPRISLLITLASTHNTKIPQPFHSARLSPPHVVAIATLRRNVREPSKQPKRAKTTINRRKVARYIQQHYTIVTLYKLIRKVVVQPHRRPVPPPLFSATRR